MKTSDFWGPFDPLITDCERLARLRGLRAVVRLVAGPRGGSVTTALQCEEDDVSYLDHALRALEKLVALDKRRVRSSYLGLIALCDEQTIPDQLAAWPYFGGRLASKRSAATVATYLNQSVEQSTLVPIHP